MQQSTAARRLKEMKRLRWGVFTFVVIGIAVSVAMNVLHAEDNIISQGIAAWPPLALAGGMELMTRIPGTHWLLSTGRVLGTLGVAGVAGSLSYVHMMGTVAEYGESGWRAAIWPISVDGLMMVAAISYVEVVRKVRELEPKVDGESATTTTVTVPDTVAELESSTLQEAPVSPAPGKVGRPSIPAKKGPAGKMVHAETGEPLKVRTEYRKRKLAEAAE